MILELRSILLAHSAAKREGQQSRPARYGSKRYKGRKFKKKLGPKKIKNRDGETFIVQQTS